MASLDIQSKILLKSFMNNSFVSIFFYYETFIEMVQHWKKTTLILVLEICVSVHFKVNQKIQNEILIVAKGASFFVTFYLLCNFREIVSLWKSMIECRNLDIRIWTNLFRLALLWKYLINNYQMFLPYRLVKIVVAFILLSRIMLVWCKFHWW